MSTKLPLILLSLTMVTCASTSWQHTFPHNVPKAWEYNSKMEGFYAMRDAWMRFSAPKGFVWDDLTQSYMQRIED